MDDESERTPAGGPVYRHTSRERELEIAIGDEDTTEAVTAHVEAHIGEVDRVWHEVVSDRVHIDVLFVAPTPERPFTTLVTSGMSALPMSVPAGAPAPQFAELTIGLPVGWPLEEAAFADERNYWPLRWLKLMARLPHDYDSWLGLWHTVPNGDPPEPFAPGTGLCGMLVTPPVLAPAEFASLTTGIGTRIGFYGLVALHADEMDLKLAEGAEGLVPHLDAAGVSELVDPRRPSSLSAPSRG